MADIAMRYVGARLELMATLSTVVLSGCAEMYPSCSWLASDFYNRNILHMQFNVIDGRTPCKCGLQVT